MGKKKSNESELKNSDSSIHDELAILISKNLSKTFKDVDKVIWHLDGPEDSPSDIKDWISTGSSLLDLAISNRPNGGIPVGRITEITGLEGCVTEDTVVDVAIDSNREFTKSISIGAVKLLLDAGKTVYVRSINNSYTKILNFIDKGILDTYKVTLENKLSIKVSANHMFYTDSDWMETNQLVINKTKILCEDGYSTVISVDHIGKYKIVDIEVANRQHCYFGNKMLNHNSGKSLVAAHLLAETQRRDGISVFIDTEAAVSREFLSAIGVNLSRMMYIPLETIEDIFQAIEQIINTVRNNEKNKLVTIVVDSVAAATTQQENDSDYTKDGYATTKAILISKAMRKITNLIAKENICLIFTNQLRQKLGAMAFADQFTTSGGKAIAFHSSVRVRLTNAGTLKKKDFGGVDTVIGNKILAKVVKNRVGPPYRKASFEMFFDSGIDNYSGWTAVLKTYKFITQSGNKNKYTLKDASGNDVEEILFRTSELSSLFESRPEIKTAMYNDLCNISIMKYDVNGSIKLDDDVDIDLQDADEDSNISDD